MIDIFVVEFINYRLKIGHCIVLCVLFVRRVRKKIKKTRKVVGVYVIASLFGHSVFLYFY